MSGCKFSDPFKQARQQDGVMVCEYGNEQIPLILGYKDVRRAAQNWQTFSSDAPFRVPIPAEDDVRAVRQIPIELDPPQHTAFRNLVQPFFRRPSAPEYVARIDALIEEMIEMALHKPSVEVVRDFALPLQSRALTYLLGMPESAADEWIGWGIHVFRDEKVDSKSGTVLEKYILGQLERGAREEGEDFFCALNCLEVDGRRLSQDEMLGIANLTFAGGRDTIINAVCIIVGYFANAADEIKAIIAEPKKVQMAAEEFVRVLTPLTHIGRVCPAETDVQGVKVNPTERVSLCWASANYDETVFKDPETVKLDRAPNPHVGFGSGAHNCLGAPQARAIMRSLIRQLGEKVSDIQIIDEIPNIEKTPQYERWLGYESLNVKFNKG